MGGATVSTGRRGRTLCLAPRPCEGGARARAVLPLVLGAVGAVAAAPRRDVAPATRLAESLAQTASRASGPVVGTSVVPQVTVLVVVVGVARGGRPHAVSTPPHTVIAREGAGHGAGARRVPDAVSREVEGRAGVHAVGGRAAPRLLIVRAGGAGHAGIRPRDAATVPFP